MHTKRVVKAAKIISDSYGLVDSEKDLVYAACLIHDITKGISQDEKGEDFYYDPMHPYTVGAFVKNVKKMIKIWFGSQFIYSIFRRRNSSGYIKIG